MVVGVGVESAFIVEEKESPTSVGEVGEDDDGGGGGGGWRCDLSASSWRYTRYAGVLNG